MKYQGIESKVNPEAERNAILEFLDSNWDVTVRPQRHLSEAIDYLLLEGIRYGIALQEKETQRTVETYNSFVSIANNRSGTFEPIIFTRTSSENDLNGDFPGLGETTEARIRKEWVIFATPKDYEAFKQKYDPDDFVDTDENLDFHGSQLHFRIGAVCPDFSNCLKKSNVYYSEKSQGRPPLTELVGAVSRQGMNIGIRVVEQKYGTVRELSEKALELTQSLQS